MFMFSRWFSNCTSTVWEMCRQQEAAGHSKPLRRGHFTKLPLIFWEWGFFKVLQFPLLLDFLSLLIPRADFLGSWIFCRWSSDIVTNLRSLQFWAGGFFDSYGIICRSSFKFSELVNALSLWIFWTRLYSEFMSAWYGLDGESTCK